MAYQVHLIFDEYDNGFHFVTLQDSIGRLMLNKNTADKIDGQDWAGNVLARLGWG